MNQLGLLLRVLVTPGNRFDGPFLPKLIEDLEAEYVLADGVCCWKADFRAVRAINAVPVIADNPRKKGKSRKVESNVLLRARCYLVEQFNGLFNDDVSDECWFWPGSSF